MNFTQTFFPPAQQTEEESNVASNMDILSMLGMGSSSTPNFPGDGNVLGQGTVGLPTSMYTNESSNTSITDTRKSIFTYGDDVDVSESRDAWKDKNKQVSEYKKDMSKLKDLVSEYVIIGVLSEEMKEKISIVNVVKPGTKGQRTINDPKMGVVPPYITCSTCTLDLSTCPGHFGRIKFNETLDNRGELIPSYIYHPLFIKDVISIVVTG